MINDEYYNEVKNAEFERKILDLTTAEVCNMTAPIEIRMRYITHVFAKTLDAMANIMIKPTLPN